MTDKMGKISNFCLKITLIACLQNVAWSEELEVESTRPLHSFHESKHPANISSATPLSNNSILDTNDSRIDHIVIFHFGKVTSNIYEEHDFLDKDLKFILSLILIYSLQIPVTLFGIITNILNIAIFRSFRRYDSITISFMALSMSDLLYCIFYLVSNVLALIGNEFEVQNRVKIGHLGVAHYVAHFIFIFQDITVLISVFIAVQKCLCVSVPRRFKNFFSIKKTLTILICQSLCISSTYVPLFAGMSWKATPFSPSSNQTIHIVFEPLYTRALSFWRYFNKIALPTSSLLIIAVCLMVMRTELKKSTMFRHQSSISSPRPKTNNKKAIKAVIVVLIIFLVSTIPGTVWVYSSLIASSFYNHPRNQTFYYFLTQGHSLFVQIGALVNIFVYLKYNTKYRTTALALYRKYFRRQSDDGKFDSQ